MFGENHYWSRSEEVNCSQAVSSWESEERNWNYENPQLAENNRQYAQLVWRGTRKFGCGQAVSRGSKGGSHTVCYYDPTATAGRETTNVLRPKPVEKNPENEEPSFD